MYVRFSSDIHHIHRSQAEALIALLAGIIFGPIALDWFNPAYWTSDLNYLTYQITRIIIGIQVLFTGTQSRITCMPLTDQETQVLRYLKHTYTANGSASLLSSDLSCFSRGLLRVSSSGDSFPVSHISKLLSLGRA